MQYSHTPRSAHAFPEGANSEYVMRAKNQRGESWRRFKKFLPPKATQEYFWRGKMLYLILERQNDKTYGTKLQVVQDWGVKRQPTKWRLVLYADKGNKCATSPRSNLDRLVVMHGLAIIEALYNTYRVGKNDTRPCKSSQPTRSFKSDGSCNRKTEAQFP